MGDNDSNHSTDPQIAFDVLALERRFATAYKRKSSLRPPRTHVHRPRHSLPANRADPWSPASHTHAVRRANPPEQPAPLVESGTGMIESDIADRGVNETVLANATVGPAPPSFATSPTIPNTPSPPKSGPSSIRIDNPAYSSLLPNPDPEHTSVSKAKRTTRASLKAMVGIHRKRDKDPHLYKKASEQTHSPLVPSLFASIRTT
ncbi:hypothetical protein FRC06_003197 [Ceratobasidium sp. 370]|nr:hypothetical protein FRC06_003197 [Ceratobasidium sp. 370]